MEVTVHSIKTLFDFATRFPFQKQESNHRTILLLQFLKSAVTLASTRGQNKNYEFDSAEILTVAVYENVPHDKGTLSRRPVYTIELSPTETAVSESSLKPMTPRRVKRRSGSRGTGSSIRRSRRSYRNNGYLASTASLQREPRQSRPTSAHSSYSNFHGARPASYHAPDRETPVTSQESYELPPPTESVPIITNRYDTIRRINKNPGFDVVGPYNEPNRNYEPARNYESNSKSYDNMSREYESANYEARVDTASPCESTYGATSPYGVISGYSGPETGWEAPPPPAPPYSARATPQAPGPPAYQLTNDPYM
ncbi:hypothetical protein ACJJTC_019577 [Scirpophaga incertulas]